MTEQGPILRIATDPTQVAVARGFAAAVLQVLDAESDTIESVRLAVSELVTIQVANGVEGISLEVTPDRRRLVISGDRVPPELPHPVAAILAAIDGIRVDIHDDAWSIDWSGR